MVDVNLVDVSLAGDGAEADRDHDGDREHAERGEADEVAGLAGRAEVGQDLGQAATERHVERLGTAQWHRPVLARRDTDHQRIGIKIQNG